MVGGRARGRVGGGSFNAEVFTSAFFSRTKFKYVGAVLHYS